MASKKIKIDISFPVYLYKDKPSIYDHPTSIKNFTKHETFTYLINSIIKFLPVNFEADIYIIFGKTYEKISNQEIEKLLKQAIDKKVKKDKRVQIYILSVKALSGIKKLARKDLTIDNRGYGNIHNLQLITQILYGNSYQINLDDDELIPNDKFFHKILELERLFGKEKRLGGVGGLYLNEKLSPDIIREKKTAKEMNVFETRTAVHQKLINFYKKKDWHFPVGAIFGGLNIVSIKVAREICFDPNIGRGEDIDFLINALFKNFLFGFSSNWSIVHKPPKKSLYPFTNTEDKIRKDIIRFIYQKRKIEYLTKKFELKLSPFLDILDPYPGFFLKLPENKLESDASKFITPKKLENYINNTLDKEIDCFLRMYKTWPKFYKILDTHKDITNLFIKL